MDQIILNFAIAVFLTFSLVKFERYKDENIFLFEKTPPHFTDFGIL